MKSKEAIAKHVGVGMVVHINIFSVGMLGLDYQTMLTRILGGMCLNMFLLCLKSLAGLFERMKLFITRMVSKMIIRLITWNFGQKRILLDRELAI